ncbi:MAG: VWA domain-containing protein [Planctomycetes bacterium]|nr:VWA domain-containing protein [Planctomycetota bacterium]
MMNIDLRAPSKVMLLILAALFVSAASRAAGYLIIGPIEPPVVIPIETPDTPPVHIRHPQMIQVKEHHVSVMIKSGIAVTTVEQVFHNPNNRQEEGTYIFPLENDSAIQSFSLWMGGKEVKGELIEKNKARKIYEDIVRTMRDPALLEYAGSRLFKCRVFPIPANGDMRIKLTYSRQLAIDSGLASYTYPLRGSTGNNGAGNMAADHNNLTLSLDIEDEHDILNIYSPSHRIDVVRKSPKHMKVSFEQRSVSSEKDFKLFYNVSTKDVGLSMIPFREDGRDGFFMAILTPRDFTDKTEVVGKDIVFVIDKSGSMLEEGKIKQAQKALTFCLKSLSEKDRFSIVSFATEAESFAPELKKVNAENVAEGLRFVDRLIARGGTAIDEAMQSALAMNTDTSRPFMVVFLTDGEPTMGERDPKKILANTRNAAKENVRVFSFGVGYSVNTDLVEMLARENGGTSTFVVPEEDLEIKVSSFYSRIASPVMTGAVAEFVGLDTYDVYPKKIGDIFKDQQLTIVGRYRNSGAHAVRLSGKVAGEEKTLTYENTFPAKETANDFLPRIWALRKVGYLLDDIRLHGETKEIREEIISLSKEYGIMTPYTSWLVIEDYRTRSNDAPLTTGVRSPEVFEDAMPLEEMKRTGSVHIGGDVDVAVEKQAKERYEKAAGSSNDGANNSVDTEEVVNMAEYAKSLQSAGEDGLNFGAREEVEDVDADNTSDTLSVAVSQTTLRGGSIDSAATRRLQKDENLKADGTYDMKNAKGESLVRNIAGRTFYRKGGRWIDSSITNADKLNRIKVKYLSDEYFGLIKDKPELARFFSLGANVTVQLGENLYEVYDQAN